MRKVLVAALALSPVMLHAQATSPAQPQASTVLESKLSAAPALSSASPTHPIRISTGVIAPKLIKTVDVAPTSEDWAWRVGGINRTAVVSMLVDETGVPSNLKIVRSAGSGIDENVIAAVKQYRFQPGLLNHAPVAVPVNLTVTIQNAR
ncbi:MAG TPA: TonB family protein [Edaphobacter sp.]